MRHHVSIQENIKMYLIFLFKYDGGLSRQTTSFLSSPQSQFVEVEFAQEPDKNLR